MAECMNRRTRRARAACARVTAPLPCSRPRGCREKPAPLEIMSRAVRIAARRLSACLTAVPKSVPELPVPVLSKFRSELGDRDTTISPPKPNKQVWKQGD